MKSVVNNFQPAEISIVVPAYNEAKRLGPFLTKLIDFCRSSSRHYEIIVVDDGSLDSTTQIAQSFKMKFPTLQVVKLHQNRGKGFAVKRGLFKAQGKICLFMDADGSVQPDEIEKNLHYLEKENYDIFIGSRVLSSSSTIVRAKWYRYAIGRIFNFMVHTLLFKDIQDTQCGFKIFKKEVVKPLFSRSYLRGFGFDIEILYLAGKMGYRIKEGAVNWTNVAGSKVNLLADPIKMFVNILQIRNWHCTPINSKNKYMGPNEYKFMYEMEKEHWWFVSHRMLFSKLITELRFQNPKILDVGAGTGAKLQIFQTVGQATGVEISPKAIEFCGKRGLRNVIQGSAEQLPFPDKSYDLIVYSDILEHLPDPVQALREGGRVLRDSGKIIVTVPAFKFLWSQHDEALCHYRRYEKEELKADFREAGLKIDRIGYLFFTSFFFVAPIRILRRFFIKKGDQIKCDTTTLPPALLNRVLINLFELEIKISLRCGLPFGTTLYAVISK